MYMTEEMVDIITILFRLMLFNDFRTLTETISWR
jgi:hypothetical protein